ncbi:hypothetical protein DBR43_23330 [Pedobacter sp. KBW06]|uniref:DUF4374 domain-containing protein n=1 Tax=Pedobacter sp. KBW06 TaxID=2153359 RepID=UPI000F5958AE|nr:DUF4374 domain-containing protein [Pedobacter sp. KBW06]RQO67471.1 hypothetical protein DBR43_23330 [Pedobacter sp. KBW06]
MTKSAKNGVLFFSSIILFYCLPSCREQQGNTVAASEKKYSIYILGKDGKEFIMETNTLDSGLLYPEKTGAKLDEKEIDRELVVRDGFYYLLNRKKNSFIKYKEAEQAIVEVASTPLENFSIDNYYWLNKDTLLLTGLNRTDYSQVKYAIIKTDDMKVLTIGDLAIPRPFGKYTSISTGFVELRNKQLFLGYTYHQKLSSYDYTTSDTTYLALFNYPQMTKIRIDKDVRSTYPGGTNMVQPYSFNDEKGNYYFMTCPGIALGNRADLPTGIFRINAGEDTLDKNYFFNISASVIRNHAYGIWYLGGNQAIIRAERKDLFKGLSDHYSTAHFEFYLIDLSSGKVLKKLELPLDKGTRRACIIVSGNTAYIAVNSTKEGNYIWLYNIKTGALKKGLQLTGDTDFIMRIDKIQK